MKTPPPDRRLIVKELEERLKKKWAAEKSESHPLPHKTTSTAVKKKFPGGLPSDHLPKTALH